jgi:hypothetical protein
MSMYPRTSMAPDVAVMRSEVAGPIDRRQADIVTVAARRPAHAWLLDLLELAGQSVQRGPSTAIRRVRLTY